MSKKKLATQRPIKAAVTIEEGQSQVTLLMQTAYLGGWDRGRIELELDSIIQRVVEGLPLISLSEDTRKSLYSHATRVMQTLSVSLNYNTLVKAVMENKALEHSKFKKAVKNDEINEREIGFDETISGMPLHYWNGREYIKKRVLPVMNELAKMNALDPNDYRGRNSLRNLAEMEVRYHNHELSIYKHRESGEKLVVSSTHADCSKRCAPYQGRVYSLDGTSGTTDDGRTYVPLEVATDIYYVTKAGKRYKNGLLGFNCRHKLLEYMSGIIPEPINEGERKAQYKINLEQRSMERNVRALRLESQLVREIDKEEYSRISAKAEMLAKEYKEFCKTNDRAFYNERLQVLKPSSSEDRSRYYAIELARNRESTQKKMNDFFDERIDKKVIIVYTDTIGFKHVTFSDRKSTKMEYIRNGMQDLVTKKGSLDRTYYDENGIMAKQIHTSHEHSIDGVKQDRHVHEYDFTKPKEFQRTSRILRVEEELIINDFFSKRQL